MSKVRLKQLDQDEISGFVDQIISGDLVGISGSLTGLISSGSIMSGAFSDLNSKVDTLSGQNTGISGRLDTIEQDFSIFGNQVDNFSGQIYGLSGNINSLSGDLSYFSGRLVIAESDISTIESNLLVQSGRIDTNSGNIITSSGNLNTKINTISGVIDAISGVIDAVSGSEVITSGKVSSISGSLNTLSENFTGFTGRYVNDYVLVAHTGGSGVNGGGLSANTWTTRTINAEFSDSGNICSINTNQITLSGGVYTCNGRCSSQGGLVHRARLYNTSSSGTLLTGTSEWSSVGGSQTSSLLIGKFSIPTGAILEIHHICSSSSTTFGLGVGSSGLIDGMNNSIFAEIEFRRIST